MGNINVFLYNCRRYLLASDPGERAVEVPIVLDLIKDCQFSDMLEVGNVLSNWIGFQDSEHKIVDKYEKSPIVENVDIVDYISDCKYSWIICISTIEHIGRDEPGEQNPDKPLAAYNNMKSLLAPGGIMVVTWPVGYNLDLDKQFADGLFDFTYIDYMIRVSHEREWRQCEWEDVKDCQYGTPYYAGHGLVIAYYIKV
jgi:hypothetical protein